MKPERWDEWECPNCGEEHEDPETIMYTCCRKCNHEIVLWWDTRGKIFEIDDKGLMKHTSPIG